MKRFLLGAPGVLLALGLLFNMPPPVAAQTKAPPGGGYEKVSTLVALPDFLPGLARSTQTPRRYLQDRSSPTTVRAAW